ncbi:MAG: hypothetical protein C7B46_19050 [Sulfobacillus benefaciens]|uniref:HTH merR-type domain-containing protein n=1 Tax=Sulfobacillus benefaciens TaxID=453960 RepID=A0A2T2X1C5_9FIRM|nr:MAG: hypothetical protein C7B46_19050 [Sulfobacillus benefaciens]
MPEAESEEELVHVQEALRLLGVSRTTLHRWDKSGVLRAYRTAGGHRRYQKTDLLRLRNREQTSEQRGGHS